MASGKWPSSDAFAPVLACIQQGKSFLVTTHRSPDADSLGSALGLADVLRQLGKGATVYVPERVGETLTFLPGLETTVDNLPVGSSFDATFIMDLASRKLLPARFPTPNVSGPIVVIDHHAVHDDFGDIVLRHEHASSTAEVVYDLVGRLGVPKVSEAAAVCLYAALISDTGGFRYSNTTPKALRLAADLLDAGVDPWPIAYRLFEDWPKARFDLLGMTLSGMQVELGGRLAILRVKRSALEQTGATDDMIEGFVNYGRMLRGIEVSALVWEERLFDAIGAPAPVVRVSLRSTNSVDATRIAADLGGGGHRRAAGATVALPLESVVNLIRASVERLLDATTP